jgi:BirA family biotin operon repressor/biotin-[acetyl-CoA-carboxylase] ligase
LKSNRFDAVRRFAAVGSTNDVAAALPVGSVVVADQQTAGRGRRGHTWFSPPRAGLYVSVVLAPAAARVDPPRATMLLTLAAGVAIAEGIEAASGLATALKWPNDVVAGGRKLAGILAEGRGDLVVLGYGINVMAAAFPPELRDRATSLESEVGREVDRDLVLDETLAALSRRYDDLVDGRFDAILDAWRARAPRAVGAKVSWIAQGVARSGVTCGIDDHGALLVRVDDGVERIISGEIQWL